MNEQKRLYRVEKGAWLAGVCGGLAEYFNIDVSLVRLLWVVFFFMGTAGFWVYLIATFILPKKSDIYPGY